ncbi:aldo/keto reductase [Acrocarpospora catenulata]|uniref:aldo/keto reductase n=1 Tax=Acrocarpospora catenulata TaxID=2836182 RepID=UPI001BD9B2F0|nr:aldo/keto reductase [Acrocarpospora catenulata]
MNASPGWFRSLGRTGVKVSPLTLGAMNFGAIYNPDRDEAARVIAAALDAGINIIDTADVYSEGESEEIVGKALRGKRDNVVLASKFHGQIGTEVNQRGNSRRWILRAVEDSLRRLGTDYLDLYQVHRPDPDTDLDDTLGALSDLVRQGKIRYYGTTTFEPHQVLEAQYLARARGYARPATEQPPYSILARGIERALLPVAEQFGLGTLTWSPLAGGWLSGRWKRGEQVETSARAVRNAPRHDPELPVNRVKREAAEKLLDLADASGVTLAGLSVAWVLRHPAVTSVIIGPRTLAQLTPLLDAPSLVLDDDLLDAIDAIVPPGVTLNPADEGYAPPSLTDKARRRLVVPAGTPTVGAGVAPADADRQDVSR